MMNRGYIRKGTVLAFLRVCRVRMNELMTAYTMESNHEAAQAAHTCRCYLDEEIQQVKKHPAADVVKVVRCRECVYWRGEDDVCRGIYIDFGADGFCSGGKRKDGGQHDSCGA